MILTNLARAMREQNYYAVVLEFLIVISGVVIGFQISAWNADRQNDSLEHEYLLRLSNDLDISLQNLEYDINLMQSWGADAEFTYQILKLGRLQEDDKARFDRGLIVGHWLNYTRGRFATMDELISTGRLTLIENPQLRSSIGQLRADVDNIQRMVLMISERQNTMMPIIHDRLTIRDMINFHVEYEFDSLVQDPEFLTAHNNSSQYLMTNVFWLKQIKEAVITLQSQVTCEIEPEPSCE